MKEVGIPSVDLDKFPQDVADQIMAEMKNLITTVEVGYRDVNPENVNLSARGTPMVLIKFYAIEPITQTINGEVHNSKNMDKMLARLRFRAFVIVEEADNTNNEKQDQRIATQLAVVINSLGRFKNPVGPALVTKIWEQASIEQVNDGARLTFLNWSVEWEYQVLLGREYDEGLFDEWDVDAAKVKEIYVGHDPLTGAEYKDSYVLVSR